MATPAALPAQFGRYRIVRQVGAGGMGAVYLAEDTVLGRHVALKVPHLTGAGPEVIERFYREARVAAGIEHPHLCAVHDVGQVDGVHYLTMPFIEGTPLSEHVGPDRPWPPRQAAALVHKLARAIEVMHRQGVIHRDLKPGNVLLRPGGEPVLMDFGLARSFTEEGQRLTGIGVVVGTPAYMSPEQVAGEQGQLGPGTDIYSLGVILYELVTGAVPFQGPPGAVYGQILHGTPRSPSAVRQGLAPEVDALCLKALAKDVADRYGSMAEFAQALEWYLRQAELSPPVPGPTPGTGRAPAGSDPAEHGLRPGLPTTVGAPPAPADATPKGGLPSRRARGGLLLAGGAAAVVLAMLLIGWFLLSRGAPAPPAALRLLPLADLTVAAGQTRTVAVRVERQNYQGAVELRLDDLPPGVRARPAEIAAGADSGAVELTADPEAVEANWGARLLASAAAARAEGRFRVTVRQPALAKEITNSIGMKLVLIPAGKYLMGSPRDEKDRSEDEEQHEVEITQPFYLGVYEVTQGQYEQVMGKNAAHFTKGNRGGPDHPVENVSWFDAQDFCDKLLALEKERAAGRSYRLPTEAEWEYACRGGARENTPFHFGQSLSSTQANFDGNIQRTSAVGAYNKPNGFGLFDMHGNVWEWCADWYGADYYQQSPRQDPPGPPVGEGSARVFRGGSWRNGSRLCRSAARYGIAPGLRGDAVGFRVALVLSGG
jgi:formylglycine-generating enzyme required for sulfatase activity